MACWYPVVRFSGGERVKILEEKFEIGPSWRTTRYNKPREGEKKKTLVALLTLAQLVVAMSRRDCAGEGGFDVPARSGVLCLCPVRRRD